MAISFPIAFEKMSGAGNDFVLIDNRIPILEPEEQPELARKICRRKVSLGADGVIFIENSAEADFSWKFYNSDGSMAEMCGNGARCAASFAYRHNIAGEKMRFETLAGIIEAEIYGGGKVVQVKITGADNFRPGLSLRLDGKKRQVTSINTGVPHAVIFVEEDDVPVQKWGREVRFHQLFQPEGTNVNFVKLLDDGTLKVRTYERGIEDETMACGTGVVAAALTAALQQGIKSPVEVCTSGGEILKILFKLRNGSVAENVYLQGPARLICTGNLVAEALL